MLFHVCYKVQINVWMLAECWCRAPLAPLAPVSQCQVSPLMSQVYHVMLNHDLLLVTTNTIINLHKL